MLRLLIADDEMIERQVLYKTLQKNLGDRCRIFQAANGREALKIYEEEKIQIVILDIEMPGINGIEAAQRIRQADKDCCIIFLTAFDEFSYAKKAITVRALDYLLKPYDEEELMLVVEEAMHIAGQHRQGEGDEDENEIPAPPDTEEPEDGGHARLSKVTSLISQYIHENYMFDISMQDAARAMNYSEAYFCKLFKQCFDQNFTSYLTGIRVNEAKKLLKDRSISVKDVSMQVGYYDSNYFAKVFKRMTGMIPSEYRDSETAQK